MLSASKKERISGSRMYLLNKMTIDGVSGNLYDIVIGEGRVRCVFEDNNYVIDVYTDCKGLVHCHEHNYAVEDCKLVFIACDNNMKIVTLDAIKFFNLCMTNSFYLTSIKLLGVFRLRDVYIINNTYSRYDIGLSLPDMRDYTVEVIGGRVKCACKSNTIWLDLKKGISKKGFLGGLAKLMVLEEY